jgi:hypothetical protein
MSSSLAATKRRNIENASSRTGAWGRHGWRFHTARRGRQYNR